MKVALMAWASNHRWQTISHLMPSCLRLWLAAFIMIFCTNIPPNKYSTTNISGDGIFISTRLSQTPAVSWPGLDSLTTPPGPPPIICLNLFHIFSHPTSSPKFSPFSIICLNLFHPTREDFIQHTPCQKILQVFTI